MLEVIIIALLSIIAAGVLWVVIIGQQRVADAREQVAEARGTIEASRSQLESLREIVEEHRQLRREESKRYDDRVVQYENIISDKNRRIDELVRQTQNLAERVASLRQEGLSEGGEDFHIEDDSSEPWSPDLQRFYEGLNSDLQAWAEEFIETRRDAGMDDEQILQELDDAGSIA